jgi:hypothetical protein
LKNSKDDRIDYLYPLASGGPGTWMGCGELVQENTPEYPAYLQSKECIEVKSLGISFKSLVGCSSDTEGLIFSNLFGRITLRRKV